MAAASPSRRQQESGYWRQVSRSTSAPRARCLSRSAAARAHPMAATEPEPGPGRAASGNGGRRQGAAAILLAALPPRLPVAGRRRLSAGEERRRGGREDWCPTWGRGGWGGCSSRTPLGWSPVTGRLHKRSGSGQLHLAETPYI